MYEINTKIFFLADILFLEGISDLKKRIFPWQACYIWVGQLRLELSGIQVNKAMYGLWNI